MWQALNTGQPRERGWTLRNLKMVTKMYNCIITLFLHCLVFLNRVSAVIIHFSVSQHLSGVAPYCMYMTLCNAYYLKHLTPVLPFGFPSSNFWLQVTWETLFQKMRWTQIGYLIPDGQPWKKKHMSNTGNEQAVFIYFGRHMDVTTVNEREAWLWKIAKRSIWDGL